METKEPESICRRFLAEGRVQGVGFRRTGAEEARRLGLDGWIRNRGEAVEALVQGSRGDVERFGRWMAQGTPWAFVDRVRVWEADPIPGGFRILPTEEEPDR